MVVKGAFPRFIVSAKFTRQRESVAILGGHSRMFRCNMSCQPASIEHDSQLTAPVLRCWTSVLVNFLEILEFGVLGGRRMGVGPEIDYADRVSFFCSLFHQTEKVRCENDI